MLKNKIISILIFGFLALTGLLAQPYYQVLADYTGQNRNVSVIESAASKLAEALPQEFRSSFKVLEYDAYVYEENMHGQMEQAWADAETKANQSSPYYILYVYLSNNKLFNFDVRVLIKLPNTQGFTCLDSDFVAILKGITEGSAKNQLLSPNVDLGLTSGLSTATTKLSQKITCCTGGDCPEFTGEEMADALRSSGYFELPTKEIFSESGNPGGGVQGNVKLNVTFEEHSSNLTLECQQYLQAGGNYARIREFNKSNSTTFKVDKPTGEGWEDIVYLNINGKKAIFLNISTTSGSGFFGVASPTLVYNALMALLHAGSGALIDFGAQFAIHMMIEGYYGSNFNQAWNSFEVDGASVAAAAVAGSLNYLVSIFGGGKLAKVGKGYSGQAIIGALSAFTGYIISNPNPFSTTECGTRILAGITASILGVYLSGNVIKTVSTKLVNKIYSLGSSAKPYLVALKNRTGGKYLLDLLANDNYVKNALIKCKFLTNDITRNRILNHVVRDDGTAFEKKVGQFCLDNNIFVEKFDEIYIGTSKPDLVLDYFLVEAKSNLNNGTEKTSIQIQNMWKECGGGKTFILLSEKPVINTNPSIIKLKKDLDEHNPPIIYEIIDNMNIFKNLVE